MTPLCCFYCVFYFLPFFPPFLPVLTHRKSGLFLLWRLLLPPLPSQLPATPHYIFVTITATPQNHPVFLGRWVLILMLWEARPRGEGLGFDVVGGPTPGRWVWVWFLMRWLGRPAIAAGRASYTVLRGRPALRKVGPPANGFVGGPTSGRWVWVLMLGRWLGRPLACYRRGARLLHCPARTPCTAQGRASCKWFCRRPARGEGLGFDFVGGPTSGRGFGF